MAKKTVLTLMRTLGLQCLVRRRKRYNSFRGEVGEAAENVLHRQFATETAHTKWATDVTEFNIGSSKVYLSPILDLHDNRIISVTAGPSPSVKMVTDSLRMAITVGRRLHEEGDRVVVTFDGKFLAHQHEMRD